MNMAGVSILQGINPIKIDKNPSAKTHEFLSNLIKFKELEEFVVARRREYKIPENGNDIRKLVGLNLYDTGDTNVNALKLIADEFVRSTGLPQEYVLQVALLVLFNSIIDLKYFKHEPAEPHEFVFGRRKIADKMWEYDHEVGAIIIPFNITKTMLKNWVESRWDSMVEDMDSHFTTNPFILGVYKNLLLEEEINQLKDKENKTFKQILEILKQKYPKQKWYESRVKKIYYDARERRYLQGLQQQPKSQTP